MNTLTLSVDEQLFLIQKETEIVYKIDEIRDSSKELDTFLSRLMPELMDISGGFSVLIFIADENGKMGLAASHGVSPKFEKGIINEASASAAQCLKKRKPVTRKSSIAGLSSSLAIPMLPEQRAIGAIVAFAETGKSFTGPGIYLLTAAASQADSAIEHKIESGRVRQKMIELTIINEIDAARDETTNASELAARSLDIIQKAVPFDTGAAVLINPKTGKNDIAATKERSGNKISLSVLAKSAAEAIEKRKDIFIDNGVKGTSVSAIPIILGKDKPFGAISLARAKTPFTDIEKHYIHVAESQLDSALEHIRVFNDLQMKNRELGAIYAIDKIRDEVEDFDEMLSAVLRKLVEFTDAASGFIVLFDDDGKETHIKTIGRISSAQKSIFRKTSVEAIAKAQMISRNSIGSGIYSLICIPLILEAKVIGTFGAVNPLGKRNFDLDDEKLINAIGRQADTAIFEDLSKRKIKDVFKRYVNENVVEEMLKAGRDNFLSGQRLHMSVLFADMRGFTAMSEKLKDPEKLVEIINEYLGAMTEVVMKHNGTLDKFVGDEVMALFGAPLHYPDHARVSIETAIAMQKEMNRLCRSWSKRGMMACKIGIGINTGDMVAGNIGCEKVTSYTVLGDNVNLGARLCSAAKPEQILLPEATYLEAKKYFKFNRLDPIMVKGKSKPINIYEVKY